MRNISTLPFPFNMEDNMSHSYLSRMHKKEPLNMLHSSANGKKIY